MLAPTLILAGRLDRFYSPALFEETAALIRGSQLRIIDRRGNVTVMHNHKVHRALARLLSPDGLGDH